MAQIEVVFPRTNFSVSSEASRLMKSSENLGDGSIASSVSDVQPPIDSVFFPRPRSRSVRSECASPIGERSSAA
jgi:hypothetical protein